MKKLFILTEFDKNMILEMHKNATQKNYNRINLYETKRTKETVKSILTKAGMNEKDADDIAEFFDKNDNSQNEKDSTLMARLYVKSVANPQVKDDNSLKQLIRTFRVYNSMREKKLIELSDDLKLKITTGIKNPSVQDDSFKESSEIQITDLKQFSRIVESIFKLFNPKDASLKNLTGGKFQPKKDVSQTPTVETTSSILLYDGKDEQTFSIYYGRDPNSCIHLTHGGALEGQSYGFCIGAKLNNQYMNYRLNHGSTFYFIVDWEKVMLPNDKGKPGRLIVYEIRQTGDIQLTDENNDATGKLYTTSEFNQMMMDKGIDFDEKSWTYNGKKVTVMIPSVMEYKPVTMMEKRKYEFTKKPINDLKTFVKLPYSQKLLYIQAGNVLTQEQFNYLINSADESNIGKLSSYYK